MKDSKSDQRLRVIVPIIANVGLLSIFLLFLAVYFLNTRSSVEDVPETRQEAIALIKEANRAVGLLENHSLDQAVPLLEQIKVELKNIAEAGEMDSGVLYVQELAQEIAAADASKAGLVKACKELESAKGKKDIEEKVQAIFSMLE